MTTEQQTQGGPPPEEVARIRGYLTAQAARLTVPELIAKLRDDSATLEAAALAVPGDRFTERPSPDDWSAAEVLTHVLDMNDRGCQAVEGILDTGALPPPIEDELKHERRADLTTAADYWRAFITRRQPFYDRVLAARGDEHLDVTIEHRFFGPLNWREWVLFMRIHDLDHMRQLQAITAALAPAR
jgi:hypothetical protein